MRNERGAGRKSIITEEQIRDIKLRHAAGESIASLANEFSISRQALYKRLNKEERNKAIRLLYSVDDKVVTEIIVDCYNEELLANNQTNRISSYAFGILQNPSWDDFIVLLEKEYLRLRSIDSDNTEKVLICEDNRRKRIDIKEILKNPNSRITVPSDCDYENVNVSFEFTKKDIIYCRTDTDGYQLKALSYDRRWFVKSQAIFAGIRMNDWAVEVMASDLCKQLNIPCVEQRRCTFVYGTESFNAVYSQNFELDGYTYLSFESLINGVGLSTSESYFVKLGTIEKLQWCADRLSEIGNIDIEKTTEYMLNLAIVDILCGNVDRHTRNFGLFFDVNEGAYEIPLIFDNGMGMFEHDYYRDQYNTFEEAMRNVYVAPYGEDPFDMLLLLHDKYNLLELYPNLKEINYHLEAPSQFASEYMIKMKEMLTSL